MTAGISSLGVLGPLVLTRDGRGVPIPTGHPRVLLVTLLLGDGTPLSRDRLIDELWGENPPASAVSALHVHLSKLRACVGELLVHDDGGYRLRRDRLALDIERFRALVEQAREEPDNARELLGRALALVRGEPLCDVRCEGSLAGWRRRLAEEWLQARLLRLDAELAAGASGDLLAEIEGLLTLHPFEERLWGQLMLALLRAGRRADALDAFARVRRRFAEELGLEPGEALATLHQQILDPGHEPPGPTPGNDDRPVLRRAPPLPRPLTRLLGRERDLDELGLRLADPEVRLLTLTGPGGVGKTRLLVELARRHDVADPGDVVFVRLEALSDPALVGAELAAALARRDGHEALSADAMMEYLRERRLLLAIDNFEHLLPAAVLVADILSFAPRVRVLVSSRTALRVRGEHVWEVEPLALPDGDDPEAITQSAAVQLFLQCASAAEGRVPVDPALMASAAEICQALDGLPLAIELAAARARTLTPAQIARQLSHPLSIGHHGLRDLPDRQRSLRATVAWSYDLLSPGAQAVLRRCAVFRDGFGADTLAAVGEGDPAAALSELIEASLVRRGTDPDRYELLELVRSFAAEALEASGEAPGVRARHRAHFAASVEASAEAFEQGATPGQLSPPLIAEHANLRTALEDAIAVGDGPAAVALALGLRPLWIGAMLRQEAQESVERILARFRVSGTQEIALLRIPIFIDYTPAVRPWHLRMARRAAELEDPENVAVAVGNLFGLALNMREAPELQRLRGELASLISAGASDKTLGWVHYFLALDAYIEERWEEACVHATESVAHARAIGHASMLAGASGTQLLSESARTGTIRQRELAPAVSLLVGSGVAPGAAFGLWLLARYAVGIAPELSLRWLVHAERVLVSLGSNLWPESVLRDESLAALGIADLGPFLGDVPTLDPADALAEAGAWLARRDPEEAATRPRGLVAWAVREDRGDPPLATAPPVAGTQPAGRSRSSRNATARG